MYNKNLVCKQSLRWVKVLNASIRTLLIIAVLDVKIGEHTRTLALVRTELVPDEGGAGAVEQTVEHHEQYCPRHPQTVLTIVIIISIYLFIDRYLWISTI